MLNGQSPDVRVACIGKPDIPVRPSRDPVQHRVRCRHVKLPQLAIHGNRTDLAAKDLREPHLSVETGRDRDRGAANGELGERPVRSEPADRRSRLARLAEPQVAIPSHGDRCRPTVWGGQRMRCQVARATDLPDYARGLITDPNAVSRSEGRAYRIVGTVRRRNGKAGVGALGRDPPNQSHGPRAKPDVAVPAGRDPGKPVACWNGELGDGSTGSHSPNVATEVFGEPEITVRAMGEVDGKR